MIKLVIVAFEPLEHLHTLGYVVHVDDQALDALAVDVIGYSHIKMELGAPGRYQVDLPGSVVAGIMQALLPDISFVGRNKVKSVAAQDTDRFYAEDRLDGVGGVPDIVGLVGNQKNTSRVREQFVQEGLGSNHSSQGLSVKDKNQLKAPARPPFQDRWRGMIKTSAPRPEAAG